MAKKSMLAREAKRERIIARYARRRAELKAVIKNPNSSPEQVDAAVIKLQKLPRDSGRGRIQRRCRVSGRPRGVYRKFGLGRNKLREAAMRGDVPGLVKSSW